MLELRYEEVAKLFTVNHQLHFLGYYDTLEEAAAARAEADLKFKFHANHGK